jgi:hypothetical protein
MRCERCANLATHHATIVDRGRVRELHLCDVCVRTAAEFTEVRERAQKMAPPAAPPSPKHLRRIYDFVQRCSRFRSTYGREPSAAELIELLQLTIEEHPDSE